MRTQNSQGQEETGQPVERQTLRRAAWGEHHLLQNLWLFEFADLDLGRGCPPDVAIFQHYRDLRVAFSPR
jgi:hypothetical protein